MVGDVMLPADREDDSDDAVNGDDVDAGMMMCR
jgi:hypothetical protein